ncbi:MAG: hypothetical protein Q8O72_10760 [Bacteroidales bacterium]|nr:hypothetical protein [Bacteroidales bacterium]
MESNIEKAGKYLEAAKINQENLWKRRQIEWKTSFSLWTAIAVSSGFIYMNMKRPLPCPEKWIFLIIVFVVYFIIICLQKKHLKAISLSNERDLDFINYNTNRAAWELESNDLKEKPQRPEWAQAKDWMSKKGEKEYYENRISKMRHLNTQIMITGLIAILSFCILLLMCFEK